MYNFLEKRYVSFHYFFFLSIWLSSGQASAQKVKNIGLLIARKWHIQSICFYGLLLLFLYTIVSNSKAENKLILIFILNYKVQVCSSSDSTFCIPP